MSIKATDILKLFKETEEVFKKGDKVIVVKGSAYAGHKGIIIDRTKVKLGYWYGIELDNKIKIQLTNYDIKRDNEKKEQFSIPMITAMSKSTDSSKIKSTCPYCGFNLPTYPGRYPINCPSCDNKIGREKEEMIKAKDILKLFNNESKEINTRIKYALMIPMEHIDEIEEITSEDCSTIRYKNIPDSQFEVNGETYDFNAMVEFLERNGVVDAANKIQNSMISNQVSRIYLNKDPELVSTNEGYRIHEKINEGVAKDGIGIQREKEYFKYIIGKNTFRPTGNVQTVESIPAGIYKVCHDYQGLYFDLHELKTDEILSFEDVRYNQVLNEINEFWDLRENFHKMGFTHKRGIILYGPPGTGKSCLLKLAMSESVNDGNIVLVSNSIRDLHEGILKIKDIEPERRLLAVAEDVEELNEHSLLQILDGDDQMENFLFLTTTNYIERIPQRVLRPSRLDRKIEVLNPPAAGRKAYFTSKLETRGVKDNINELVSITDGFSFAQLREFMVSVYCLKQGKKEVAERIRKGFETSGVVSESFDEKIYTVQSMSKDDINSKRKELRTKYYKGEIDKDTYTKRDNELRAAIESDNSEKCKTNKKKMITAKEILSIFNNITEKDSGIVKVKITDKSGKLMGYLQPSQLKKEFGIPNSSQRFLSDICKDLSQKDKVRNYQVVLANESFSEEGKCPPEGCIKKVGDKYRVISNKTGKLWPQEYDSEQDAKDAISAYHIQRNETIEKDLNNIVKGKISKEGKNIIVANESDVELIITSNEVKGEVPKSFKTKIDLIVKNSGLNNNINYI